MPCQVSMPAFSKKNKKIKFSMPGQLFLKMYKPSPRACQVSYFENITNHFKSMPGQPFLESYEPNPMPCQVSMSAFSKKNVKRNLLACQVS